MSLGPAEILVIFVIALLVFGPSRLPEVGRQVGRGLRELRKLQHTVTSDLNSLIPDDATDHVEPAPSLPPIATNPTPQPSAELAGESSDDSAGPTTRATSGEATGEMTGESSSDTAPPPDPTA